MLLGDTQTHVYRLFKKPKGALGQKFFSAKACVDLWNESDDNM